jgi:hypothetical protein
MKHGFLFLALLAIAPSVLSGGTINYALLSDGASILSVSSQLDAGDSSFCCGFINGGQTDARNNLLRTAKVPYLGNGETGFIFHIGDADQRIRVDLGELRTIDSLGAALVPYDGDREVWDFVDFFVSTDNITYSHWGIVGARDGLVDITTSPVFVNRPDQSVRYIEYDFGRCSNDYGCGGSRVSTLFADEVTADPTVPEPGTLMLLGTGLIIALRKAFPKTQN